MREHSAPPTSDPAGPGTPATRSGDAPRASSPSPRGDLALLACAVAWGTTFPITRLALEAGTTPLTLNGVRFLAAAAVLLPVWLRRGARPGDPARRGRTLAWGVLAGLLLALGFALQTFGLSRIGSTRSAFLTGFYVLLTPLLEWLALRRRPSASVALGVALAFGGLAVMAGDAGSGTASLAGDAATLACALVFAGHMVALSVALRRHASGTIVFLQIATCGLLSLGAAPLLETPRLPLTAGVLSGIAFLAVVATVIVLALQAYGQKRTTATRAAVLFSSEPVWAALFAALAGEAILGREIAGGALILAGLVVASLPPRAAR